MLFWILIGLCIITKVHGFSSGNFPQSCESMLPEHLNRVAQNTESPFEISYQHGEKGEPITVFLRSNSPTMFRGFILEAREKGTVDVGPPVGKFILLEPDKTRLLTCSNSPGSAVSQKNNVRKTLIRVNWTAEGAELDITLRATFVVSQREFWEKVDVNVIPPTPPPPTTQPSTTAHTTMPSTTAHTTMPSTTANTTTPSITELKITTLSAPTGSGTRLSNTTEQLIGTVLMTLDLVFVVFKMQLPNVVATTNADRHFSHPLKVSVILCCLICAGLEISAAVFFFLFDSCEVTLFSLVCVAFGMNFIELVIVSLSVGPSHELKEIYDFSVKVCSAIHKIFTITVIFVGVLKFEMTAGRNNFGESWLLKVMIANTVWILLSVIWVFVFTVHRNTVLGRSKTGNDKRRGQRKKKLSAVKAIGIAVSVILILGTMSFAAAVIFGIFSETCV